MIAQSWSVSNLSFRYNRSAPELFDGLTHSFEPGVMTGLTGASGRGKSTLLYILGQLLRPSTGEVLRGGEDLSLLSDGARSRLRAEEIGFVFQDASLDPTGSVERSVAEPGLYAGKSPAESLPRALELLEKFGLGAEIGKLPSQISGGQAQRVAICRALFSSPGLILADEPTGNLDRRNGELVLEALAAAAAEGRTVVIATHDPFVLEHTERVLEL
ncbi:ABC transporter ATP-binding protein [Actinomyces minihominis]|uniref:ABC transporter ATP-binding protein n=1 Tax=Actinomyces minihominis TaxID=2002838 RepID=UPI000C0751DD|nr:ATP-binding cassette domain-containing protein [Actinomyces minihominis]